MHLFKHPAPETITCGLAKGKKHKVDFMNGINRRLFLAVGFTALTYFAPVSPASAQSISPAEAQHNRQHAVCLKRRTGKRRV
jgi:hypothetical protein